MIKIHSRISSYPWFFNHNLLKEILLNSVMIKVINTSSNTDISRISAPLTSKLPTGVPYHVTAWYTQHHHHHHHRQIHLKGSSTKKYGFPKSHCMEPGYGQQIIHFCHEVSSLIHLTPQASFKGLRSPRLNNLSKKCNMSIINNF